MGLSRERPRAIRLLDDHGVATLPGSAFGDPPDRLALRIATPMLYGPAESQRWQALGATTPAALPWVADALEELTGALESLRPAGAETTDSLTSPGVASD